VRPARLPNGQGVLLGEFSFEAEEDPAVAEEELHRVAQRLKVRVEVGSQDAQQLSGEKKGFTGIFASHHITIITYINVYAYIYIRDYGPSQIYYLK
jgi:hypothetical protein